MRESASLPLYYRSPRETTIPLLHFYVFTICRLGMHQNSSWVKTFIKQFYHHEYYMFVDLFRWYVKSKNFLNALNLRKTFRMHSVDMVYRETTLLNFKLPCTL